MNLSDLSSGPVSEKLWLNIQCNTLNANAANITDMVVVDLSSDLITLNNQVSVPNAPLLATSFWSSGTGNLSQTDSTGSVVTYATMPVAGGYVVGSSPSVVGNLPSYDNVSGDGVSDSGIASSNLFLADGSVAMTGHLDMDSHDLNSVRNIQPAGDILIGTGATSSSPGSNVVIGDNNTVSNIESVSIGPNCTNDGFQSTVIGPGSICGAGNFSVCIGRSANASGAADIVLGQSANSTSNSIVIGSAAQGGALNSVTLGRNANCTNAGDQQVSIGFSAVGSASGAVCVGSSSAVSAQNGIALGAGANNSVANTCLIGNSSIANIRPSNSSLCDLGVDVTNRFANLYADGCLLGSSNRPVDVGLFSQYADVNVNNTVVETTMVSGSAVGSLLLNPSPLGAMLDFSVSMLVTSVAGDNLDIRWYTNAGILFTNNLTIAALSTNVPVTINTKAVVRNGTLYVSSTSEISGNVATIVGNAIVYDRNVNNQWNLTAQWGANVNQMSVGLLNLKGSFSSTS